jgi:hypothetical protein
VVLCDLDGRTHEEAARHLGCPVGTVKSRLARGRERLRDRLTRRGLGPEALFVVPTGAPLPTGLAGSTAAAVLRLATAGDRAIPAAIARDVMRSMFLAHLGSVSVKLLVGIAIGTGVLLLYGAGVPARQAPGEKLPLDPAAGITKVAAPARPAPEYAWRRMDR